jgi:hypothetical protein
MRDTTKAATPIECVQKGGDPEKTVVWACGTCKLAKESKDSALECCSPYVCEKCGKECKSYCEDCSKKERFAREQATYDKAKKVMLSEYSEDWLFCDHCEEYFSDVDSLLDAHDDAEDPPTWAWGTYETPFTLNASDVLIQFLEQQEFYEEAFEHIDGAAIDEMQNFFDAWLKKQNMKSYMVDYSTVVDIEALVNQRKKERNA